MNLNSEDQRVTTVGTINHSYDIYNYHDDESEILFNTHRDRREPFFNSIEDGSRKASRIQFFSNNEDIYQIKSYNGFLTLLEGLVENKSKDKENIVTIKLIIDMVKDVIGLNPSQLARVLGISRATLYNHMSIQYNGSIDEYIPLYETCLEIKEKYGSIAHGLKNISINGNSLLRKIEKDGINKEDILFYAIKINNKKNESISMENNLTTHQEKIINLISHR